MTLTVLKERAQVAVQVASEDLADGAYLDARDQLVTALAAIDEIEIERMSQQAARLYADEAHRLSAYHEEQPA